MKRIALYCFIYHLNDYYFFANYQQAVNGVVLQYLFKVVLTLPVFRRQARLNLDKGI